MAAKDEGPSTADEGGVKDISFPWKVLCEEEYKINPELKREDVQEIQQWIQSTDNLPVVDDEMVCHFLHACFYDIEKTKKAIYYYYTYKTKLSVFFTDLDPTLKELQNAINNVIVLAPLPLPDKDGNKLFVFKYREQSLEHFNYIEVCKWMMMSTFYTLWANESQVGFVSIFDARGVSMAHFLKATFSDLKDFSNIGKNATPLRVVRFVCINTSPVVKKLLTFMKPFLNKQLADTMSVHTDPESYFGDMPKEAVPEDYGGSAPAIETLHSEYIKKLAEHRKWIMAEANIRSNETKKTGKTKNNKIGESLQKLEID